MAIKAADKDEVNSIDSNWRVFVTRDSDNLCRNIPLDDFAASAGIADAGTTATFAGLSGNVSDNATLQAALDAIVTNPGGSDTQLQYNNAGAFGGITGATWNGTVLTLPRSTITQAVSTSGSPSALTVTGGAHTTLAALTEAPDILLNLARTVQFSAGTIANQRAIRIDPPTYSFPSASTITRASTLAITGFPKIGTNTTYSNRHMLSLIADEDIGVSEQSSAVCLYIRSGLTGGGYGRGLVVASPSGTNVLATTNIGTLFPVVGANTGFYGGQLVFDPGVIFNVGSGAMYVDDSGTGGRFRSYNGMLFQPGELGGSGTVQIRRTAEQLRVEYDASNYCSWTVGSSGNLTITPSGTDLTVAKNLILNGGTRLEMIRSGSIDWLWRDNSQAVGSKVWGVQSNSGALRIMTFDDAYGTGVVIASFSRTGNVTWRDGGNFVLGSTTGTKIGTATSEKLGFWNATPVVQQVLATGAGATVDNVISLLQTLGLCRQS